MGSVIKTNHFYEGIRSFPFPDPSILSVGKALMRELTAPVFAESLPIFFILRDTDARFWLDHSSLHPLAPLGMTTAT